MIKLSIPCPTCGCDQITGVCKRDDTPVHISICACPDGSGYFDMTVIYNYNDDNKREFHNLKYKSKEDIEAFLNRCYEADNIQHLCSKLFSK